MMLFSLLHSTSVHLHTAPSSYQRRRPSTTTPQAGRLTDLSRLSPHAFLFASHKHIYSGRRGMGKVWRPRRPAEAPLEVVGVKDAQAAEVGKMRRPRPQRPPKAPVKAAVGVEDAKRVASVGVAAARGREKGPLLEDGTAACLMVDSLDGAPVIVLTPHKATGVKDAQGVAVGEMWRPRKPVKATLEAVGVKEAKGVDVIGLDEASGLGAPMVTPVRGAEKGPSEDGVAMCRIDALNGAPVITTTRQKAVGLNGARGVIVGKMWQPRQPTKAPLKAVGVKDAQGVTVITVDSEVEASVLGAPMVAAARGRKQRPHEDAGTAACIMDSLNEAPVIATARQKAVGAKKAEGVAVGKMWRPRRPTKAPLQVVGVKDAEGVGVIAIDGKVEASVLGALVVTTEERGEKGPLEEGIAVCQGDALDGPPVISTAPHEETRVKSAQGVAVGKSRRPRRSAKKPLQVLGVKDAEGVAVITFIEEVEPLVLGVPVVTTVGGREKGSLEDGIEVCRVDALSGASDIATDEKEEVSVQGDPVVAAAGGGEKGSLEDGIVVCRDRVEALDGDPIISNDEKEEVEVQGNPVFPVVDQKVDAPVLEAMQTITMKGNGKEEKDKEGIKWLKHYSTAQSILIIGDGDFSFSLALATVFGSGGNIVATSLDSYGALTLKYGKAESNVRELERLGATVFHGVDAETMKLHSYLEMRRFDRIVFNFPHAGFKGREDQLHVISSHKKLVHGFLANARQLLRPYGEIHISHKKGFPYDAWGIKKLAYESCLIMVRKVDFSKEDYPGYNQKRGDGPTCDESFPLGPCCTFMFCAGDVEKLKKAHGNRVGLISPCLGDNKFYPGISATGMMWPFDLHHPAWPQPHFPPVHMPIAFDPCPIGVAGMEGPFDCYGTSFHHQDMVQPTHQEQPWYLEGPPIETPWTPQEHQNLQREYEIHKQLARSLEDRYMESVERQATLEMLIEVYGRH